MNCKLSPKRKRAKQSGLGERFRASSSNDRLLFFCPIAGNGDGGVKGEGGRTGERDGGGDTPSNARGGMVLLGK